MPAAARVLDHPATTKTRTTRPAPRVRARTTKVILPDTVERQTAAALAAIRAAEAKRPKLTAVATPRSNPVLTPAPAKKPGPVFDLDTAIRGLRPEYIECRDWGHNWLPRGADFNERTREWETSGRCSRCESVVHRFRSARGQILRSSYEYAEGFQMVGSGGLSSADRDHIRLASMLIPHQGA